MITSLILLYFTVFIAFQWGQRIAMTSIDTKLFLIWAILLWILLKSII